MCSRPELQHGLAAIHDELTPNVATDDYRRSARHRLGVARARSSQSHTSALQNKQAGSHGQHRIERESDTLAIALRDSAQSDITAAMRRSVFKALHRSAVCETNR
ncbi:hypothetical protein L1887_59918 [Cichorium endivia]|nr:hypothetical protein L1887_59918 [Cichorium endivia]